MSWVGEQVLRASGTLPCKAQAGDQDKMADAPHARPAAAGTRRLADAFDLRHSYVSHGCFGPYTVYALPPWDTSAL